MATIRFNSAAFGTITDGQFGQTAMYIYDGSSYYGSKTYISGGNGPRLIILKGSIPSFPTFTDLSTRNADVLVNFPLPGGTASYNEQSSSNSRRFLTAISSTPGATASGSGTASWFILYNNSGASPDDLTIRSALLGTVGGIGSGADLEVFSTSITIGDVCKSNGFFLNFPYDMTI